MINKLLRGGEKRQLKKYGKQVISINRYEEELKLATDEDLAADARDLKARVRAADNLDELLPETFALVRETASRTLKQRPYDTQLVGAMALHDGYIAEMKTGEGKTLTSTLAITLNAYKGLGVHVVTVNDYLAKRDAEWMEPLYTAVGLTVAYLQEDMEIEKRKKAYQADVTYGTNSEFGFDYLRDHLAKQKSHTVQRPVDFAIIDEVDNILIDDARTPLIISAVDTLEEARDTHKMFKDFAKLVKSMDGRPYQQKLRSIMAEEGAHQDDEDDIDNYDYEYDEKKKVIWPTDRGVEKAEKMLGVENIHATNEDNFVNHLRQALTAEIIYKKDRDYSIVNGEVAIIDVNTGRILEGHRWSNGLHQAVEAKEKVKIVAENHTLASVTYQNYFRLYPKLAGMTGTAMTEATEFQKIYGLKVLEIPTNLPIIREDHNDKVYRTMEAKWKAVLAEIKERHATGQPILVGTASVENSEYLSKLLKRNGLKHELLNAKPEYASREAEIISHAGEKDKVTIATNMAGRGVDIKLGKDDSSAKEIKGLGGLYVLATERHDSRRIDNQLRGRSGRQGDPGETAFYVSAEDEMIRLFAGDKLKASIARIEKITGIDDNHALEFSGLTKMLNAAQAKVEEENFLARKHILEFDDVINEQRRVIYEERDQLLDEMEAKTGDLKGLFTKHVTKLVKDKQKEYIDENDEMDFKGMAAELGSYLPAWRELQTLKQLHDDETMTEGLMELALATYDKKREQLGKIAPETEAKTLLNIIDEHWKGHLDEMDYLREGIHLRGFAQLDPVIAYKNEGFLMFNKMMDRIWEDFIFQYLNIEITVTAEMTPQ